MRIVAAYFEVAGRRWRAYARGCRGLVKRRACIIEPISTPAANRSRSRPTRTECAEVSLTMSSAGAESATFCATGPLQSAGTDTCKQIRPLRKVRPEQLIECCACLSLLRRRERPVAKRNETWREYYRQLRGLLPITIVNVKGRCRDSCRAINIARAQSEAQTIPFAKPIFERLRARCNPLAKERKFLSARTRYLVRRR